MFPFYVFNTPPNLHRAGPQQDWSPARFEQVTPAEYDFQQNALGVVKLCKFPKGQKLSIVLQPDRLCNRLNQMKPQSQSNGHNNQLLQNRNTHIKDNGFEKRKATMRSPN